MKSGLAGAALAACLLASGCFDMKQDFRFNSDETAEVTFRIAIDAALIALAQQGTEKPFCTDEMIARDGITGTAKSTTEGADVVCTLTISGPIAKVVDAASNAKLNENAKGKQAIALTRDGEAYVLQIDLPPPDDGKAADNPMAKTMQAMMLAKMSGKTLAWTVTAPSIIETSGTLSDDGRVASYSRPLAEAFTSREPTRFSVRFSLKEPGLTGWIRSMFR